MGGPRVAGAPLAAGDGWQVAGGPPAGGRRQLAGGMRPGGQGDLEERSSRGRERWVALSACGGTGHQIKIHPGGLTDLESVNTYDHAFRI